MVPPRRDSWYRSHWEREYESRGPISEIVLPDSHACVGLAHRDYPPGSPVPKGGIPLLWDRISNALGDTDDLRIADMGGGPNPFPGALNVTSERGGDWRDVSGLPEGEFDLIISSHSIEHALSDEAYAALLSWIPLLRERGRMLLLGPHRCSSEWSPLLNEEASKVHLWAPTASCVGNLMAAQGMRILGVETHVCKRHSWWVLLERNEEE
jgi:hypothetical protein